MDSLKPDSVDSVTVIIMVLAVWTSVLGRAGAGGGRPWTDR
jgi:hypothetical protein